MLYALYFIYLIITIIRFYEQLKALKSEEKIAVSTNHPSCNKPRSKAKRENVQSKDEELSPHRTSRVDISNSDEQLLCFGSLFEPDSHN